VKLLKRNCVLAQLQKRKEELESACVRTAELETTTAVSPGSDDPPFTRPVAERRVGKYENSYAPLFPTLSHNLYIIFLLRNI
jgi:hypothetical protein